MEKIIAVTERLIIREIEQTDEELVGLLHEDDTWLNGLIGRAEENETKKKENWRIVNSPDTYNGMIFLRDSREFVGKICMQHTENEIPDLGINIMSEHQNKHYAAEATAAFCNYYSEKHKLKKVIVQISDDNSHSIHVFEKIGAEYIESVPLLPEELWKAISTVCLKSFGSYCIEIKSGCIICTCRCKFQGERF